MKRTSWLACASFAALAATACGGDDDDDGTPAADANPGEDPDADPGTPDAAPAFVPGPDSDDGGEVRLEYVNMTPAAGIGGRDAGTRATAFFIKNQTPAKFPFLEFGECKDISTDARWPTAQDAASEYIDVGQVIITGGPSPLTVPRGGTAMDPFGRVHKIDDTTPKPWYFHFGVNDTATYITPNTDYNVVLTGSEDWPFQTFEGMLRMPAEFDIVDPGAEMFSFTAGQAKTITWEQEATTGLNEGEQVIGFVGVIVPGQGPVVACAEDPNDGSVTIPAELVNKIVSYGVNGTIARQNVVHRFGELTNGDDIKERRIDFIAVWCHVTQWNIGAP